MTQMPGFKATLAPTDIAAVAAYIKANRWIMTPVWGEAEIGRPRRCARLHPAAAPVFKADPMNITLVVETGDSHVSVLDGDTFEVLDRFRDPLCRAWRAEVQPRRALCLHHVARRLGAEIRHLVAGRGRPHPRRPEQPQHRDEP
jgi:hypothetical protein